MIIKVHTGPRCCIRMTYYVWLDHNLCVALFREDDVSKEIEQLSLGKEPEETNGDVEETKPLSAKAKKREKV